MSDSNTVAGLITGGTLKPAGIELLEMLARKEIPESTINRNSKAFAVWLKRMQRRARG